ARQRPYRRQTQHTVVLTHEAGSRPGHKQQAYRQGQASHARRALIAFFLLGARRTILHDRATNQSAGRTEVRPAAFLSDNEQSVDAPAQPPSETPQVYVEVIVKA